MKLEWRLAPPFYNIWTRSGNNTPHRSSRLARQPRDPQDHVLEMGSSSVWRRCSIVPCSIVPMHPVDASIHLFSVEPITGGDTQNPTGTSVEHADNTLVTIGHLVPDVTTDRTETHEANSAPSGTPSQRPSRKRTVSESALFTHFLEYKLRRLEDAKAFQQIRREDHAGQPAQILVLRTDSSKLRASDARLTTTTVQ